ncbi:PREDICTED: multiple C2 and transmembrane domain-containing protein 1-like [Papilio xuthus]|uniref:Multiple C2 and transmembrane domain-containing protein 1-like n=1 Tax=Papilio xuthus TaxID=66420 RepID=A0AAJ6Z7I7_PAPXU|nr:PREDICTED: multiple C2 and transmembrane domain-containing protein 1-like [Papilio xuthus]
MSGFYDFAPNFRDSTDGNGNGMPGTRNIPKSFKMWRSTSLSNLVSNSNKNRGYVYESAPFDNSKYASTESLTTLSSYKSKKSLWLLKDLENFWDSWDTIVTIILVAAKDLPRPPNDGTTHELYGKFRLGSETFRSKSVLHTRRPEWRERFKLHLHKDHSLKLTLWDRGRQKIFMGSCALDLSKLEKERTHDIWQDLDDGYGSVHLSVTMCVVRYLPTASKTIKTDLQHEQSLVDWNSDWRLVGCLKVKVIRAKGLSGKPSAYCTLELDNERLQTHTASSGPEPVWDKSYVFNVYDVTSVLTLKIYSSSLTNAFLTELLGQVSIPLLKITNGETRWYALKNRNNRNVAKGNYPRILLRMNVTWNPIKATLRLFQPKEVKYIEAPPKWDILLLMRNLPIFVDYFHSILYFNEIFKRLFEWNNREMSAIALFFWLMLCYHLTPSAVPLMLLLVFIFLRIYTWIQGNNYFIDCEEEIEPENNSNNNQKDNKGLTYKINDMQEIIITVSNVLALIVSLVERLKNLITFQVPFLSYVVMSILALLSLMLYFLPFNYLLMLFGIYKFMRKYLNPDRILNNDLVDFISRIPDDRILKDWKELNVPEPVI